MKKKYVSFLYILLIHTRERLNPKAKSRPTLNRRKGLKHDHEKNESRDDYLPRPNNDEGVCAIACPCPFPFSPCPLFECLCPCPGALNLNNKLAASDSLSLSDDTDIDVNIESERAGGSASAGGAAVARGGSGSEGGGEGYLLAWVRGVVVIETGTDSVGLSRVEDGAERSLPTARSGSASADGSE
jgi:hypothetical protein